MVSISVREVNGSGDAEPTSSSNITDLTIVFLSEPFFPPQSETPGEAALPTFLSSDPIVGYLLIKGVDPESSDWRTGRVKIHLQGKLPLKSPSLLLIGPNKIGHATASISTAGGFSPSDKEAFNARVRAQTPLENGYR